MMIKMLLLSILFPAADITSPPPDPVALFCRKTYQDKEECDIVCVDGTKVMRWTCSAGSDAVCCSADGWCQGLGKDKCSDY